MGRLKELRKIVDGILREKVTDADRLQGAYVHLYGVSLAAALLSEKRKENQELGCMAAMLHDIAAYVNGSYDDHAHKGAEMAGKILRDSGLTSPEETEEICKAIYCHDDKQTVNGALAELLKDADVMHHTFNDLSKPVKEKEQARYEGLRKEFSLD